MRETNVQVTGPAESAPSVRGLLLSGLGAVALLAVVGAPAAASWHGLVHFARAELQLAGGWEYIVPVSLDGAAIYSATLALRAVLRGDSAIGARVLTCMYALGAAAANAVAATGTSAALFFGGMSVSAVVLWDATLRMARRDQLRQLGVIEGPAARFRPLRWVLAPGETAAAWRVAVVEGICEPGAAVREVRGLPAPPALTAGGVDDLAGEVAGLSKADAVRAAVTELGTDAEPAAVVAWLQARGLVVAPSYVSDVARRDRTKHISDVTPLRRLAS